MSTELPSPNLSNRSGRALSTGAVPRHRSRLLVMAAVLGLLLAACGSNGEEIVAAGADGDDSGNGDAMAESDGDGDADDTAAEDNAMDDNEMDDNAMDDGDTEGHDDDAMDDSADSGFRLTKSNPDMTSPEKTAIDEVVVVDDQTLGVRYEAGAEPCALANVTITESDSSVTVLLETGLHPNVAAMSCMAVVSNYEIRVPLDQPIGDREIVIDGP